LYYSFYRRVYFIVLTLNKRLKWLSEMMRMVECCTVSDVHPKIYLHQYRDIENLLEHYNMAQEVPDNVLDSAKEHPINPFRTEDLKYTKKQYVFVLPKIHTRDYEVNNLLGDIQRYGRRYGIHRNSNITDFHEGSCIFDDYSNIIVNMAIEGLNQVEQENKHHLKIHSGNTKHGNHMQQKIHKLLYNQVDIPHVLVNILINYL